MHVKSRSNLLEEEGGEEVGGLARGIRRAKSVVPLLQQEHVAVHRLVEQPAAGRHSF